MLESVEESSSRASKPAGPVTQRSASAPQADDRRAVEPAGRSPISCGSSVIAPALTERAAFSCATAAWAAPKHRLFEPGQFNRERPTRMSMSSEFHREMELTECRR